jgi:PAS domain S-box-containing protein
MAARVRSFDWSKTALGPMDRWPQSLRVALGVCLNSRFPMFVWWGPDLINIYNDAYVPILGKRHPHALGRPAKSSWGEIWPVVGPQAEAVMQRGEATWNDRVLLVMERHGYTEDTYFTWSYSPIPDESGGIGGLFCACTEETGRVRAEKQRDLLLAQLGEERNRLTEMFRQSPAFLALLRGPEHVFEMANDRYYELVGRRDIIGLPVRQALPEVDGQGFLALLDRVYASGESFVGGDVRVEIQREPGQPLEERFVDFAYQPIRDASGTVTGIFCHGVDLTERKRAEEALRASERRLHTLFENTQDAILLADDDARYVDANPAASEMTGYGRDELLGKCAWDLTPLPRLADGNALWRKFIGGGRLAGEYTLVRKDGTAVTAEYRAVANIQPGLHLSVLRDVTDRKRAMDRLSRLHSVAAALSEALTKAEVARVTVEQGLQALGAGAGTLCLVSDDGAALEMVGSVGFPPGAMEPWKRFPLDAPVPLADAVRTGEPVYLESPEQRLERYPALARVRAATETKASACIPLIVGGKAVGVLGLSFPEPGAREEEDRQFMLSLARQCAQALERARLFEAEQAARAEAERASRAKDEFLAVLSHELRTPLTPVLLTVSLMESHPELPADLREDVATIRRNVELESRLISDLLDLTRVAQGKLQLEEQQVDLHLVVRSAVEICRREQSARLAVELGAARHTVVGDATRLQQVLWNLVNNAQKFTPPDGVITVRSSDAGPGRVRVEVSDTGAGIDPSVLPRLFNAFEQGEARVSRQQAGLGLGLTISKKLAEAHGGTITAFSEGRGRGATFTVELPVVDALAPQAKPPRPARLPAAERSMKVLLVEDHEPTLKVLSKLLGMMGHRVTGAASVAEAAAAADRDGFDLIISDLGLPDGSGLDVMRQLKDRYSGRAIALTGYGMESDVEATRNAGFALHLTKPVDMASLEAAIRCVQPGAASAV